MTRLLQPRRPIPSGGEVTVSDLTRSTVSPYTFSAMKETGAIILDGYVDSREANRQQSMLPHNKIPVTAWWTG